MTIADKAVLVTGANSGLGQALVEEALRRGAARVYAGTRQALTHEDRHVTAVALDVTNGAGDRGHGREGRVARHLDQQRGRGHIRRLTTPRR